MRKKFAYAFLTLNFLFASLIYYSLAKPRPAKVYLGGKEGNLFLLRNEEYFPLLRQKISEAREEIRLAAFLFKTDSFKGNTARILLEELIAARRRGVRVRVLLEREGRSARFSGGDLGQANELTSHELARAGIEVKFDSPRKRTHAKVVVIDRRFVFLGSHNLTKSAFQYNNELSVLIDSPALAQETLAYLDRIEAGSS